MVRPTYGALYGAILVILGIAIYLLGVSMGIGRAVLQGPEWFRVISVNVVWYSAAPVVFGLLFFIADILFIVRRQRRVKSVRDEPLTERSATVVLTAYNDEASIGPAVKDFLGNRFVKRVIVVSNNSSDNTVENAEAAGAIVFNEEKQGYGACVWRCLSEGAAYDDTEVIALCEGDMTFRAADLEKLFSFIQHADIVNGTRIVEKLQERRTQISTMMHYGNLFVGKLLEAKFLSRVTLSDVGTTFKIVRTDAVRRLLPKLDTNVNLEFNPYLIETAIRENMAIVECPITFHPRVGVSKGGNISNLVALRVGFRMILGILFGWRSIREKY